MSRTFEDWMSEYQVSHRHPTNQWVHKICVPAIAWSTLALLWLVQFSLGPLNINLAVPTVLLAFAFHFSLKKDYALYVGAFALLSLMSFHWIAGMGAPLLYIALGVFALSWVAQLWGHHVEGKKPSFFQDLAFLLIGPLWVVKAIKDSRE